jgi:hypothetical protein
MTENEKQILETKIHNAVKARNHEALITAFESSLPGGITPKLLEELQDYGFKFLELYRNACLHDFLEAAKNDKSLKTRELAVLLPVSGELSSDIKLSITGNGCYLEQIAVLECRQYIQTSPYPINIA